MTVVLFVAGTAALIGGAELMVRGASRLAAAAGIAPLVVGLTVVALGTSAPEAAVTVGAALSGAPDMAVGNVVGSNIFNVLFILGASALVAPLVVAHDLVRLDVPVMIAASIMVLLLALDGRVGRLEGLALFTGAVGYTAYLIARGRRGGTSSPGPEPGRGEDRPEQERPRGRGARAGRGRGFDLLLIALGILLLAVGARWLVGGAVEMATALGVSELVVGLTIVAAGTSLPEVATSILASIRGQRDIAVGNVVGSNIFNLLAVLGLGSVLAPGGLQVSRGAMAFDLPVMIGVALTTLPMAFTGYMIARWEGLVLLGYYGAYIAYLALDAAQHQMTDELGAALLYFVVPLTAITLVVLAARARSAGRGQQGA